MIKFSNWRYSSVQRHFFFAFAVIIIAFIAGVGSPGYAASTPDLSAFIGRWQIDPERTKMGRDGPSANNILRSNTFTFQFVHKGEEVEMDVYAQYPLPEPTRTQPVIADGKVRVCMSKNPCLTVGGDQKDQTFAWYAMDEHMLARLFWVKGQMYDYSSLTVSSDGKTLTLISWKPATPYWQNIQVFTRQE
jgi:hypothetical protein